MKMEEIQRVGRRCPCGKMVYGYNRKLKRPQEYCHGHDQLGKKHPYVKSGKDNPSYRGSACKTTRHYIRTQKPKPNDCDSCGSVTTKLKLCSVKKVTDSTNVDDWGWICNLCQFPRAAKFGKVSDHLCECLRKCGEFTLYGWSGKVNRYVVGHNAAGQELPANQKPGVPSDQKYRARWYAWMKHRIPRSGNCPSCGRPLLSHKSQMVSKSGSYIRDMSDGIWTCRYGICSRKYEEGLIQ